MTQSELKRVASIGAELGAAKAENEKLRGLLDGVHDTIRNLAEDLDEEEFQVTIDQLAEIELALAPKQPEPTDTFTAVDMASAAAQGFRDGQAAVEQATAQDEQQPVVVPEDFQPLETIRWWISAYTNPENGPSYQGHGMMVQMLCEYEALRIMLSSRAQQWPTAYPHEAMDKLATDRYRVGSAGAGTLHRYAVRAGDGDQELYRGSESDCQNVARKLAGAFLDGGLTAFGLYAAPIAQTAPQGKFRMGDLVKKSTGSEWVGRVVGWYSTNQTPEGYAVESSAHRNSVQIYQAKALEAVE